MRNSRPLAWLQRVDRLRQVPLPRGKRERACSFACMRKGKAPVVYSTDRSKAVVPVLVLHFVALWLRGDLFYLLPCYFVLVFFSPFSIAITSLGEERANLSAFRTFVRFALVWFCLLPLPLGVWEGLRFVNVAFFFCIGWDGNGGGGGGH